MANKSVIFPESKLTSAEVYRDACNLEWSTNHEPGGLFCEIRLDYLNQHVVAYFGPPFSHDGINVIPEPAHLIPLRADGVIHDFPIWPDDI